MTKQFFKLVPVSEYEISRLEPYVAVVKTDVPRDAIVIMNAGRPDWVLNVIEGSVGVFNMKKLTA